MIALKRFVRQISTQIIKTLDMSRNYEDAVRALNTLQSNAAVLQKVKKERDQFSYLNIPDTIQFCSRAGITLDDIDKIPIIHVSGTKGKGSTCAFCESILRHHGYRTGFYSSPHLSEVRERIRINGRPLSKDGFSSYFWDVFTKLDDTRADYSDSMPAYFRFLTIMAFHVFIKEKVDVAIFEVGVGGEYDCTNIIRNPVVVGISSLGIDHVGVLGDTIGKIAWHKAGIMKPGIPAVTVPQPCDGLDIIAERAIEKKNPLYLVPSLEKYDWQGKDIKLGIVGDMQKWNASLAVQLAQIFMKNSSKSIPDRKELVDYDKDEFTGSTIPTVDPIVISDVLANGLHNTRWPGRNHVIKRQGVTYYLDGAHTARSMDQCVSWFKKASQLEADSLKGKVVKVIIFNSTGNRTPQTLMEPLMTCGFECALFTPNVASLQTEVADQKNYNTTASNQMACCHSNCQAWQELDEQNLSSGNSKIKPSGGEILTHIFPSVSDSLKWLLQGRNPAVIMPSDDQPPVPGYLHDASHIQLLVTGSLHLVGCALRVLDPELNDRDC